MAKSNYPNGFEHGLTIRNKPIDLTVSGNVYFVGKTPEGQAGSDGYSGTYNWPFATIDFAIGKCIANHGDIIFVKAGHTETITTAGAITCDVVGVSIIGLGSGADRPTITFGSTDNSASIVISAASTTIENIIGTTTDDGLTNPFHVQAADCWLDIEWRDASAAVEAAAVVLTTQAAENLCVNLKYIGFITGNACVTPINLIGVNTARINVDFYGEASTAVVNMGGTTASDNVFVSGYFYNDNVALTKNVVDTVTGSKWFATGYDGKGGYSFSGGSAATLAADDVSTIAGYHTVPTADTSTNAVMRDVVGNKTDAAVTSVGTTKSIMAYAKGLVNNQVIPVADTSTNAFMRDAVGGKADAAVTTVATTKSIMAYTKGLVNNMVKATADTSTNAFVRDVVGNKTDAAYATVSSTKSLVAYTKALVNEMIIPVADTSTNAHMRDVIGGKADAAYATVSSTKSLVAYTKALVNEMIVPTANTSTNAHVRDVVGNKTDNAASGAVGSSDSAIAYLKQLVTGSLTGAWVDGPTASHPNYLAVSADFTSATWATTAAAHEILTVTGAVRVRVLPRCSTSLGPVALLMKLGTSAFTSSFIGATTVSMIDAGEFWVSSTTNSDRSCINYSAVLDKIVNDTDIGYTLSGAAAATAGVMVFHVWWEPLSSGATVTAGAGGTLA